MIPFGEVVGGGCRKRDSASSKLKFKKQASFSLGPVSTFFFFLSFLPSRLPCLYWCALPFFLPFVVCHLKSSLPNENVALLTSCLGTAVSSFGYLLHSHFFPLRRVMRSWTAAVRHERGWCRCIGYEGSCVSYSPRLASACGLTQGSADSGWAREGDGVQVTFWRETAH